MQCTPSGTGDVKDTRFFAVETGGFSEIGDVLQEVLCRIRKNQVSALRGCFGSIKKTLKVFQDDFKIYFSACKVCVRSVFEKKPLGFAHKTDFSKSLLVTPKSAIPNLDEGQVQCTFFSKT